MPGFESSFSEGMRPDAVGEAKGMEGQKIVDLEFTTDGPTISYRKKFGDGSVGNWQNMESNASDPEGFKKEKKSLMRDLGLIQE